jgi:hypothetical protein
VQQIGVANICGGIAPNYSRSERCSVRLVVFQMYPPAELDASGAHVVGTFMGLMDLEIQVSGG